MSFAQAGKLPTEKTSARLQNPWHMDWHGHLPYNHSCLYILILYNINQPSLIAWNHPKDGCYRSESPANHAQEIHRLTTMAQGTFAVDTRQRPRCIFNPKRYGLGSWNASGGARTQGVKILWANGRNPVFDDMSYPITHQTYTGHLSSHTVPFNPNHRGPHFSKALKTMQQLTFSCSLLSNKVLR